MVHSHDVPTPQGGLLRAYESGPTGTEHPLVLMWHHGSPQTGALLSPLCEAAEARRIRLISYGRPGYGGSTGRPERDVASAAADAALVADALGVESFAAMGASGGGPHALACGALLRGRVQGVVTLAGLAPYTEEFDWFEGMAAPGGLRSARAGTAARAQFAESEDFDPSSFVDADYVALEGRWSALGEDVARSALWGDAGLVADDVAFMRDWGFAPEQIEAPVLLVQGGRDRVVPAAHADWMLGRLKRAELWLRPRDGHVSVLDTCAVAMDWLLANAE